MKNQTDQLLEQITEVRRQANEFRDLAVVNVLDACRDHIVRSFVPEPGNPLECLTENQADVALLVGKGYKLAQIEKALGLSKATVCSRKAVIYQKLNISCDIELTLLLVRHGVVVP